MSVDYIGNGNDDGTNFGQSSTDKIGFYGLTTPIVQQTISGLWSWTTSTGIVTQAALDGLYVTLKDIHDVLVNLGLVGE